MLRKRQRASGARRAKPDPDGPQESPAQPVGTWLGRRVANRTSGMTEEIERDAKGARARSSQRGALPCGIGVVVP